MDIFTSKVQCKAILPITQAIFYILWLASVHKRLAASQILSQVQMKIKSSPKISVIDKLVFSKQPNFTKKMYYYNRALSSMCRPSSVKSKVRTTTMGRCHRLWYWMQSKMLVSPITLLDTWRIHKRKTCFDLLAKIHYKLKQNYAFFEHVMEIFFHFRHQKIAVNVKCAIWRNSMPNVIQNVWQLYRETGPWWYISTYSLTFLVCPAYVGYWFK